MTETNVHVLPQGNTHEGALARLLIKSGLADFSETPYRAVRLTHVGYDMEEKTIIARGDECADCHFFGWLGKGEREYMVDSVMYVDIEKFYAEKWGGNEHPVPNFFLNGIFLAIRVEILTVDSGDLEKIVRGAWENRYEEPSLVNGTWLTREWLQQAIDLYYHHTSSGVPPKYEGYLRGPGMRGACLMPDATVYRGAHIEADTVFGSQCVVHAGASIGAGTVVEDRVTIGSTAQVGKNCIISTGAIVHGIVEDGCIIGPQALVGEGVVIRSGSVLDFGVCIPANFTQILDPGRKATWLGEVPKNATVMMMVVSSIELDGEEYRQLCPVTLT